MWTDEAEEGKFIDDGGKKIPPGFWVENEPNGKTTENCVVLRSLDGRFVDLGCETELDSICAICQLNNVPKFSLRGLCHDSNLDSRYRWTGEVVLGRYTFHGHKNSLMRWDPDRKRWLLFNENDPIIYAYTHSAPYPFEINTWIVVNDTCDGILHARREVKLNFNACGEDQFNCDNALW